MQIDHVNKTKTSNKLLANGAHFISDMLQCVRCTRAKSRRGAFCPYRRLIRLTTQLPEIKECCVVIKIGVCLWLITSFGATDEGQSILHMDWRTHDLHISAKDVAFNPLPLQRVKPTQEPRSWLRIPHSTYTIGVISCRLIMCGERFAFWLLKHFCFSHCNQSYNRREGSVRKEVCLLTWRSWPIGAVRDLETKRPRTYSLLEFKSDAMDLEPTWNTGLQPNVLGTVIRRDALTGFRLRFLASRSY
jgi:hypothetical protein